MALDDAKMAGLSQRRKIIDETTTERYLLQAVNWRAWEMDTIMLFGVNASHINKTTSYNSISSPFAVMYQYCATNSRLMAKSGSVLEDSDCVD